MATEDLDFPQTGAPGGLTNAFLAGPPALATAGQLPLRPTGTAAPPDNTGVCHGLICGLILWHFEHAPFRQQSLCERDGLCLSQSCSTQKDYSKDIIPTKPSSTPGKDRRLKDDLLVVF